MVKELFVRWQAQGAKDATAVDAAIKGKPEAQQLEYLRLQIEMRVLGLGWTQFSTRWSSKADSRIGTVAHLRALLVEDILPEERAQARLKGPEAAADGGRAAAVHGPGPGHTACPDAAAIASKSLFSKEELEAKAEAAVKRREAVGISDYVENMQPPEAPPFEQALVGKQSEAD